MILVDSHAHIYLEHFKKDLAQCLERASEGGVSRIYMPNIDVESIDAMMEVEHRYPHIYAMMGLHPCSVDKSFEKKLYVMEDWYTKRDFVAVGEIGTDLYWDSTYWAEQKEALRIQLHWASEHEIPAVLHCRESIRETIDLVASLSLPKLHGVFHCFTGTVEEAKEIIELGFKLGFGGVSTFKNGGLDTVIPEISLDDMLLETDAPYLAPVPHRGKRNEPCYLPLICKRIAELKEVDEEQVASVTTKNANAMFQFDAQHA